MVRELKRALLESSQAVETAVRECAGLAKQVQEKWEENIKFGLLVSFFVALATPLHSRD
jgi:hypothetical protein